MYRKSALLFSCFLLACMVISCNGGKNKPSNVNTQKGGAPLNGPPVNTNGNLYILYLTQSEMQGLLNNTAGASTD